jgi:hypothetical protein
MRSKGLDCGTLLLILEFSLENTTLAATTETGGRFRMRGRPPRRKHSGDSATPNLTGIRSRHKIP